MLSVANNTDSPGQHRENEVQDRYQQYDQSSSAGVSQTQYTDSRLKNKEQVVGIRINEDYRAYPFFAFKEKSVINDVVDQTPILVFHHHDSGVTAVFLSRLETKQLTFVELSDHLVKDHQSQTVWNLITGTAIEGELKGKNWQDIQPLTLTGSPGRVIILRQQSTPSH